MLIPVVVVILTSLASTGSQAEPFGYKLGEIAFPPARPSVDNLQALCTYGSSRPRYPKSFFPPRGFSHQRRCGAAVNRVEVWYSPCCAPGQTQGQALCCAQQAWEYALEMFCLEEVSVKDIAHHCCTLQGENRLTCFQSKAPNKSYLPTPGYTAPRVPVILTFAWDPSTC